MMNEVNKSKTTPSKTRKIVFTITTAITVLGMLVGGATQFFRLEYQVDVFEQLEYPLYLMSIIGLGKMLGAIALIIPGIPPIFKISAYAGLFFVTTGAVVSHTVQGMPMDAIAPLIVAGIAVTSCLLHPKLKFAFQKTVANEIP